MIFKHKDMLDYSFIQWYSITRICLYIIFLFNDIQTQGYVFRLFFYSTICKHKGMFIDYSYIQWYSTTRICLYIILLFNDIQTQGYVFRLFF